MISALLGVYTAVVVLLLKVPVPLDDHVAEVAPPPKEPAIVAVVPEQIVWFEPALTMAGGLINKVMLAFAAGQTPAGSSVV